ncbi:MAG: bifunctional adenosylcobinamide kinase/adenosylcobinamide-phosphate guanylyltransferase [Eubacterium sp.]|nr:bifunctional adenosylcobinamide kinase/adenosylcobinamide-phosphate guanylyltransferase [Eubacterium sp.]
MITMVYGGSGSGKSEFAEELCMKENGEKYYIATMQPYGEEGKKRIERHRALRAGKGFITIEQYVDMQNAPIEQSKVVLLECLSNLVANEVFRKTRKEDTAQYIYEGICKLQERTNHLVVVTNDVFTDGNHYDETTREYMKVLGCVNRMLAKDAQHIYEVVVGIGIKIK